MLLAAGETRETLGGEIGDMEVFKDGLSGGFFGVVIEGAMIHFAEEAGEDYFLTGGGENLADFVLLGEVADLVLGEAEMDGAGGRFEETEDAFYEGGFAGAVGADDAGESIFMDDEGEVFEDGGVCVAEGDGGEFYEGGFWGMIFLSGGSFGAVF